MLQLPGDKVAIQGNPPEEKTAGGIIIPDIAQERTKQGLVKYVGPDCKHVKKGDYVIFGGYDGTVLRMDGEGYLILMREIVIKAVVKAPVTDLTGVYYQAYTSDGKLDYFPATYESLIELINGQITPLQIRENRDDRSPIKEAL